MIIPHCAQQQTCGCGILVPLRRRELVAAQLGIDAAVEGDRQKALQCLLLDPVITDIETAKSVLDAYLDAYKQHLPQFWK